MSGFDEGDYDQSTAMDINSPIEYMLIWMLVAADPVKAVRECQCHVTMTWCMREPFQWMAITFPVPVVLPRRRHPSLGRG